MAIRKIRVVIRRGDDPRRVHFTWRKELAQQPAYLSATKVIADDGTFSIVIDQIQPAIKEDDSELVDTVKDLKSSKVEPGIAQEILDEVMGTAPAKPAPAPTPAPTPKAQPGIAPTTPEEEAIEEGLDTDGDGTPDTLQDFSKWTTSKLRGHLKRYFNVDSSKMKKAELLAKLDELIK
jgi:hypothetical protein